MKKLKTEVTIRAEQEWRKALTPFLTFLSSKKNGINVEEFRSIGSNEDRNFIIEFLQKKDRFYNPCDGRYPENEAEWHKTLMQYRYKSEINMSKAFISEGPRTGKYKFAPNYMTLTHRYCLNKQELSLINIIIWLYRDQEFNDDMTVIGLRDKFIDEFKIIENEITDLFINDVDSFKDRDIFISVGNIPVESILLETPQPNEPTMLPPQNRLNIGRRGYLLFKSIIEETGHSVKILTNRIKLDTIRTIFINCKEGIKVEIITNVVVGDTLQIKEFFKQKNISLSLIKCKRLHAKLLISDDRVVLIGSSNLTRSSLGGIDDDASMTEVNVVTTEKDIVQRANELFEIIRDQKANSSLSKEISNNDLMSSVNGFPSKMERLMRNAKKVTIIVPSLIHKSVLGALRMMAHENQLEIITNWPKSSSKSNRMGLGLLRSLLYKRDIKFIPLSERERIHAKVYVFTMANEKKIVAITSANLTHDSWHRSVEVGFLTEDKEIIRDIEQWANNLRKNRDLDIIQQNIKDKRPTKTEGPVVKDITETIEPKYIEGKVYKLVFEELYEEFKERYKISDEEIEPPVSKRFVEIEYYDDEIDEPIIELIPETDDKKADTNQITGTELTPNVSDMAYIYAIMILLYAKKEINKDNLIKIISSAGGQPDEEKLSVLFSCLKDFDWDRFKETVG